MAPARRLMAAAAGDAPAGDDLAGVLARAMADDFARDGVAAIEAARAKSPDGYLKIVATAARVAPDGVKRPADDPRPLVERLAELMQRLRAAGIDRLFVEGDQR